MTEELGHHGMVAATLLVAAGTFSALSAQEFTVTHLAGSTGGPGWYDGIGTSARLSPLGVAADGQGNIYIADTGNCTIRKMVLATGSVTTLAGVAGSCGSSDGTGNAARFKGPWAIAADGRGNLFVADTIGQTIRQLDLSTGAVSTLAGTPGVQGSADGTGTAAQFRFPEGILADGQGNVFVADTDNKTIRKIVIATRTVTTIAGKAGEYGDSDGIGAAARFSGPKGLALDEAGHVYVADFRKIRKLTPNTAEVVTVPTNYYLDQVWGVAVGGDGHLYVTLATGVARVALATGAATGFAGNGDCAYADGVGSAAGFCYPFDIAADGAGNLFVADGLIRKIVIQTRAVTTIAGAAGTQGYVDGIGSTAQFNSPGALAADSSGNLYVSDEGNGIRKIAVDTRAVTTFDSSMTTSAIAVDTDGTIYMMYGNSLVRVDPATHAKTLVAGSAWQPGSADGVGSAARFWAAGSSSGEASVTTAPDVIPPVVTAPEPVGYLYQSVCCGHFGGATASNAPLSPFLAGGSATDNCDPQPVRLPPELSGAAIDSRTCFEGGSNTVVFSYRDAAGNVGSASSTVRVWMYGDLNLDGAVDPADLVILRAYLNFVISYFSSPPWPAFGQMGDLNDDWIIDATDFVVMRSYLNGAVPCLAP